MFCSFFPFPPPPPVLFSKHSRFFMFSCLFFFFCHPFQHSMFFFSSTPFRYYSRFVSLALWTDRSERPRLDNTFSYHMGLRGRTWEDGPQSAVFSACLHLNLISISVINAQGLTKGWFSKRVVLADKILDLLLVSSFWFSQPFRFGKTMVVFLRNSSSPLERTIWFFDSVLSSFFFLPFLSLLLSFKANSIASPFPNPSFLHLGPPGFSVVGVLIVVVFFISVFLVDLPFLLFVSVVLLLRLWQQTPFSLQFWGFSKGC